MKCCGLGLIAVGILASMNGAMAASCQEDINAIDEALKADNLAADVRAQADDLRNQAVQLCGAGNEDEGSAMATEAKVLLKIE